MMRKGGPMVGKGVELVLGRGKRVTFNPGYDQGEIHRSLTRVAHPCLLANRDTKQELSA